MTKLTYVVNTPKGTCEVKTLSRAKEIVAECGGSYTAKYASTVTYNLAVDRK